MKKIILILVVALLATGCSYSRSDYETELSEITKKSEELESSLAIEKLETQRHERVIKDYENEIIPGLQSELEEQQQSFEVELEKLREENKGLEHLMLWFKKDIDQVLGKH